MTGNTNWTDEEIEILKEKYPIYGKNIDQLHRTKAAISTKASKKDIKKEARLLYKLSEAEKTYVAGIVDSEGSVGFHIREHQSKKLCLEPIISISNKNKEFLKKVKHITESNCYLARNRISNLIFVGFDKIYSLLKNIQNFLIVKRRQGNNLLEFIDSHEKGTYTKKEYLLAKEVYEINNGYKSDEAVKRIDKIIKEMSDHSD